MNHDIQSVNLSGTQDDRSRFGLSANCPVTCAIYKMRRKLEILAVWDFLASEEVKVNCALELNYLWSNLIYILSVSVIVIWCCKCLQTRVNIRAVMNVYSAL